MHSTEAINPDSLVKQAPLLPYLPYIPPQLPSQSPLCVEGVTKTTLGALAVVEAVAVAALVAAAVAMTTVLRRRLRRCCRCGGGGAGVWRRYWG